MSSSTRRARAAVVALAAMALWLPVTSAMAENIDPAGDGSRYVYLENVGWLNAEPAGDGGPGIQVGDSELSGWMWGENVGWISLSCRNTLSCATLDYGVLNDGNGVLSGHAWAENLGWINFAPTTSGVTIDPATGEFNGFAWGENVGWVSFNCANTASCGDSDYKVNTGWICDPPPPAPVGVPAVTLAKAGEQVLVSWTAIPGATQYDIVVGDLAVLLSSGGNLALAVTKCLDDNCTTDDTHFDPGSEPFEGAVVLVRGTNCGGSGSYDSGGISQAGPRDGGIAASGNDCPY